MNTSTEHAQTTPPPVLHEYRITRSNGDQLIWESEHRGSQVNLTTGDICHARMVDQVRYDVRHATLVAGWARLRDLGGYRIQRLYRGNHGKFFAVAVDWYGESAPSSGIWLAPIPNEDVVLAAQRMVTKADAFDFLRDWYLDGWLPRNDAVVQAWAERALSADDCEWLLAEIRQRAWPLPRVEDDC